MNEIAVRKNYYALDIAKFIGAVMILSSHFAAEQCKFTGIVDYFFSLYVFAVPFFFVCSAFLFFKKLNALPDKKSQYDYFIKYEKRIWIMYLLWSVIYWCFRIGKYLMYGTDMSTVMNNIHSTLTYSSYGTIWFLPALAVAIAVIYVLRNLKAWKLIIVGVILYFISCLGYSYIDIAKEIPIFNSVLKIYNNIFFTTRNGLFNGVPFAILGYFIATNKKQTKIQTNIIFALLFSGLAIIEALACKIYISPSAPGADTLIMLIPAEYFIVRALIQIEIKERWIYGWMRKLSLLMFTSQRLFLSAIPILFPAFMVPFKINPYLGLIMMNVLVIVFDIILIKLSEKFKAVGYLV